MGEKINVQVGIKGRSLPPGGGKDHVLVKNSENDFDCTWKDVVGGTDATIPQPYGLLPNVDTGTGNAGGIADYARGDHSHQANVGNSTPVMDSGLGGAGTSFVYARADHYHPTDTSRASDSDVTAFKAMFKGFTVTLGTTWTDGAQTVSSDDFIASGYAYIVTPASGSLAEYAACKIYADNVSVDEAMTFHCETANENQLTVNIVRVKA